jgi:hypothetical protein
MNPRNRILATALAAGIAWMLNVSITEALAASESVGHYRLFEATVTNDRAYSNKFADVELLVQYQAPSGRLIDFRGFFDGDGKGGGNTNTGNIWKMRFMPDELGTWNYVYRWSDGTAGGRGSFKCVAKGAGKGVLRAYANNPRWFAYNGTEPVWLKSYYETGHGSIGQDFDWIVNNVYSNFVAHGYNHLQVNWLLSLCCFEQFYRDGPAPETTNLTLYAEGRPSSTMNLDVWRRMERHLGWMNDHDINVHMFLGVNGGRNHGPAWEKLSPTEKDFYVRYTVARIAPYANLAGWNFVWEVEGNRETHELGFARLVAQYDVFNHLRTYEDEFPRENYYHLPEYTFAAVENHHVAAPTKHLERHLWRDAWTHHMACLVAYQGKPVYMSEGNSLWRRFWMGQIGATQDDLRRAAWACATAGASFNWNGHEGEEQLYARSYTGLPFNNDKNPFTNSARYVDVVADVMTREVEFYRMQPHDELLAGQQVLRVYALAEPGRQYLVFAPDGEPFGLKLETGEYSNNVWINTRDGKRTPAPAVTGRGDKEPVSFRAPGKETDWVLILRAK